MFHRTSMTGVAALAVLAAAALAADSTDVPKPKTVHFAACTMAGVEYGCVMAKGDDGILYNVTNASPRIKPNQWLQGKATVTDRASFCMQGQTITGFVPDKEQKKTACGQ